jgi:hypothetical protein
MNTSDVQVYTYVTDDGHHISFSLAAWGELTEDRRVDVTIMVDGVERLHTSGHTRLPAGTRIGEWLIQGVLQCIGQHMDDYNRFHLLANLFAMANSDDPAEFPTDDRHISELTNEQAEWWNEDGARSIGRYVLNQIRPAVLKILEEHPHLREDKEND